MIKELFFVILIAQIIYAYSHIHYNPYSSNMKFLNHLRCVHLPIKKYIFFKNQYISDKIACSSLMLVPLNF